ncbi:hypothetical protein [Phenylobacterium sp.]|uniref:hypothetical protein n=1 Tax=Phenylobacterium sp. TaxID=1871053 RepID=UPI0027368B8B|nr:hypothetical protein [Phenylobacterium sp.]MDP3855630.1 hypothetical protein [Phenylobacterium sp.]
MTKPNMLEDGWLKKSIDEATVFADRNKAWAETISANWQDDGSIGADEAPESPPDRVPPSKS